MNFDLTVGYLDSEYIEYVLLKSPHVGVDQNEGSWGSCNRQTTANQPRSQPCQSRDGSVVSDSILRKEWSKHCYTSQYLETWREPGPNQMGLQSRINREPIADFIHIS